jgi:APA family basic amino acid/polyamine antiporter
METKPTLKRSLGLTTVTLYGVGAILGAGIYVLIGEVAGAAGYLAPLSFLVAAIVVIFSAFSYAELSARYPRSAGEAVYVEEAFGNWYVTQAIGLMVIFTGIVSAATMATGIVGYMQIYLDWPSALIISLFVIIIGGISCWGIKQASWIVIGITLLEVSGLIFIAAISIEDMSIFPVLDSMQLSSIDGSVMVGLFLGSFLAFYAFIGFEDMVNIAEEIQQPEKVLPKAILLAMIISTVLYMFVIFAAVSVLQPAQLAASQAPLADVAVSKGYSAAAISLISIIAVVNGAIVQLIMASRVVYGMAANRLLPQGLAQINAHTATPVRASVVCITITLILALLFPLGVLAQATSFIVLCIFALVNLALIRINQQAISVTTVHYPGWVPYVGALLCLVVLAVKLGLLLSL